MKQGVLIIICHLTLIGCGGAISTGGGGGSATVSLIVENPNPTATGVSKSLMVGKASSAKSNVDGCTLTISAPGETTITETATVAGGASEVTFNISNLSSGSKTFEVECEDASLTSNGVKSGFSGSASGAIASSGNSTINVSTQFLNFINDGTNDAISTDIESVRCYQPDASNTKCVVNFDAELTNTQKEGLTCYIEFNGDGTSGTNGIVDASRTDASRCGLAKDRYLKITTTSGTLTPVVNLYNSVDVGVMRASGAWGTNDDGNSDLTVSLSHKQMKSKVDSDQNAKWCAVCLYDGVSDAVPNSGSAKLDFSASTVSASASTDLVIEGATCADNGDCGTGLCDPFNSVCLSIPKKQANPMLVSGGNSYLCMLMINGTVSCWGQNKYGELGRGTVNNPEYSADPSPVLNQDGSVLTDVVEITAGVQACARLHDGSVKCWGCNGNPCNDGSTGGVGNGGSSADATAGGGTVQSYAYPVNVIDADTDEALTGVTSLKAGFSHACVIQDGGVKCWGNNGSGQCGTDGTSHAWPAHTAKAATVQGLGAGSNVVQIGLGESHSCALISDGTVKCWGLSKVRLGWGSAVGDLSKNGTPDYVVTGVGANGTYDSGIGDDTKLTGVDQIWVGHYSTCAKRSDGIYCWGGNGRAQLADGSTVTDRSVAAIAGNLSGFNQLALGRTCACGIVDGVAKCWGENAASNCVGTGSAGVRNYYTPQTISFLASKPVQLIMSNYWKVYICAVLDNGDIQCWGENESGQLGEGTTSAQVTPNYATHSKGRLKINP
ncbi:MAG: hypothetical protein Q8P84_08750 [Deltaproteobacteria bacterium]|nr:hypothetical protein [Deltaproteobacteria bacterium]